MQTTRKNHEKTTSVGARTYHSSAPLPGFDPHQVVEYFGRVCNATNEKALSQIKDLLSDNPQKEIVLLITSAGGPSGTGMSFYDTIRYVLRPRLVTVGAGDVDSSGVILFLSGETRFVTPNTTMLLHLAGRTFDDGMRFTAHDLELMAKEDRMKDELYADIVADNSHGKLTRGDVVDLMTKETVLSATDMLTCGIADTVLS